MVIPMTYVTLDIQPVKNRQTGGVRGFQAKWIAQPHTEMYVSAVRDSREGAEKLARAFLAKRPNLRETP